MSSGSAAQTASIARRNRSRAAAVFTFRRIQVSKVIRSSPASSLSQGLSGSTFPAMRLILAMATPSSASATGLAFGIVPL